MRANIVDVKYETENKVITILPLEVHYSKRTTSNGFSHRKFREVIHRLLTEKNTYAIFPGDLVDSDRPTMRTMKRHIYADEDRASAQAEDDDNHRRMLDNGVIAELRPVAHKIWGLLDGDHYVLYQNGTTSTQYVAQALKIPHAYIGRRMGWVIMRIIRDRRDSATITINVRHGKGGASTIGSDINKLINQSNGWIADLYIGGHTHRKWVHSIPFIGVNKLGDQFSKPIGWARAGSLLDGFPAGKDTYAGDCEYSPLPMGYPEIYLYLDREHDKGVHLANIRGLS